MKSAVLAVLLVVSLASALQADEPGSFFVKLEDLEFWSKVNGRQFCSVRKAQTIAALKSDIVKARKLKNKEAQRFFEDDLDRLTQMKVPIFLPILPFTRSTQDNVGAVGFINQKINVFRILSKDSFEGYVSFGNGESGDFVIKGFDCTSLNTGEVNMVSESVFMVKHFQTIQESGGGKRSVTIERIDTPDGVFIRRRFEKK